MTSVVQLTLTSIDGLDSIPERTIVLDPNKPVSIGRSSKNPDKGLMAALDNALIDSPVISREHAVFSTSADMSHPNIFVTDDKSRQGTYLNGAEIKRGVAYKLANNDTLCFGQNVVRDTDSFIAQKYRVGFRAMTPELDRSFPRGISVPEATTSDEEDVDFEEPFRSSPYPPSYGSQANPVNVDDFEDAAPTPVPRQPPLSSQPLHFQLEEEATSNQLHQPPPTALGSGPKAPVVENKPVPPIAPSAAGSDDEDGENDEDEEESEEDDDEALDYPDEDDDGFNVPDSNQAMFGSGDEESEEDSDNESVASGSEASDESYTGEDADAVLGFHSTTTLTHENPKCAERSPFPTATTHIESSQISPKPSSPPSIHPYPSLLHPSDVSDEAPKPHELGKEKGINSVKTTTDPFFSNWDMATTMPRPPAPKTFGWGGIDYSNPMMVREEPTQNMWFEDRSSTFAPASVYGRSTISPYNANQVNLSPYIHRTSAEFPATNDTDTFPSSELLLKFAPAGLSTPPARVSDNPDEASSQPAPRTKVSIAEIVDDHTQGPMTPTSVNTPPSRKRKAEVLEADEEEPSRDVPAPANDVFHTAPSPMAEVPSVEPPRKKARSALSLVASGMAAGFVLGGAVVISALASIDITQ